MKNKDYDEYVLSNIENIKNKYSYNKEDGNFRHTKNTSGATGVHFNNKNKKYQAYICVKGKRKHLGMFENLEDAVKAREKAQKEFNFHKNSGR